jgi:hypothetical protein
VAVGEMKSIIGSSVGGDIHGCHVHPKILQAFPAILMLKLKDPKIQKIQLCSRQIILNSIWRERRAAAFDLNDRHHTFPPPAAPP